MALVSSGSSSPSGAASGDLSGTYPGPTVARVNGVGVTGTPQSGYVPTATSASAATWQAVNAGVSSVFTRSGAVVAAAGDYTGVAVGGTADALAALALTNAMVNPSAAIAYSKLALTGSVVNADVAAAAAMAISKLADPGTGKVVGSASSAAAAVFPPGFEIGYTQITSAVNVTGTSEATATTIITAGAATFDGAAVIVEFFAPQVQAPASTNGTVQIVLFESSTAIGTLGLVENGPSTAQVNEPVCLKLRFTPSAASHTYIVKAHANVTTGTPLIGCGAGGTTTNVPAFIRFTKV